MTFEDIDKLNRQQYGSINIKRERKFNPGDLLDINDNDDDEILRKIRGTSPRR